MKRMGIIGLGKMGQPMACRLLDAGYSLAVFDVLPSALAAMTHSGVTPKNSPRDVVEFADVVILSLPDGAALCQVVCDSDGLASMSLRGKAIIDASTVPLAVALECADVVKQCGGHFLDSPVTGGAGGAQKGMLQFFVGGDAGAFSAQRDVYEVLGNRATLIGPNGHGQVAKMVCQMIGSVAFAINAEAMALCDDLGVDTAKVAASFDGGGRLQRMVSLRENGDYGSEGYMAQRGKDLDCVVEAANSRDSFIPVTKAMHRLFNMARADGLGDADPAALFAVWDALREQTKGALA